MKKITYLLILIFFGSCKSESGNKIFHEDSQKIKTSDIIIYSELGKRIDSLLLKEQDLGFSGSVVVISKDTTFLQNGYGWTDSTKKINVTPKTLFYLASTTKGVTGVATLLAQEKGLLNTNDSIGKYFSDISIEHSKIKINDLLTHTSLLSNEYETFGHTTMEENISLVFKRGLNKDEGFVYSGAGYWLTVAVIQKASQTPYHEFVRKNIFSVARMKNTKFWFEIDDNNNELVAQKLSKFPPNDIAPNWGFRGSSGILTNIKDFKNYFLALTNERLISAEGLNKLFGPHLTLSSNIGIGYGWFTTKTDRGTTEIWSRGGEEFGHNSAIRWFKDEDVLIAILTSCGELEGEDHEANRSVSDKIAQIIFKKK